jgi:hypothetical protein
LTIREAKRHKQELTSNPDSSANTCTQAKGTETYPKIQTLDKYTPEPQGGIHICADQQSRQDWGQFTPTPPLIAQMISDLHWPQMSYTNSSTTHPTHTPPPPPPQPITSNTSQVKLKVYDANIHTCQASCQSASSSSQRPPSCPSQQSRGMVTPREIRHRTQSLSRKSQSLSQYKKN